ncbi:hypothetical protein [Rhodobacter maris]|uniref:Uncharacterized protein n=1 Tax=Rhodobacter maris TaxID=446682 RepID=A0A285S684_9RHOB|nr:hypothetical protein [Rhodobacter maris]SOC02182.1 hypothetical protein SAMN05877831_10397 [Rhodobacter maris]
MIATVALSPEKGDLPLAETRAFLAGSIITTCRLALENGSSAMDDRAVCESVASTLEVAQHLMMLIDDGLPTKSSVELANELKAAIGLKQEASPIVREPMMT